jgi:hypothetical protein
MPHRLSQKMVNHDSTDHDILLQLVEMTKYIADKQTEMRHDQDGKLQEIKQNQEITIAKMDARLVALETLVVKNNVEERIRDWNYASDIIRDLERDGKFREWNDTALLARDIRKSWKLLGGVIVMIAGAVSWLVQMLLPWFRSNN